MNARKYPAITLREELTRLKQLKSKNENMWDEARVVMADVPLDRQETRKILPLMMSLTHEAKATLFMANYEKNSFTVPYREAGLMIHVKTPFGKGLHCAWMLVDDDIAMVYGREILGYPKKMGRFVFQENNRCLLASVERGSVELIRMEAAIRAPEQHPLPVFDIRTFNVNSSGPLIFAHPVWLFRPRETILQSHDAVVNMTLNHTDADPVARYIDGPPTNGRVATLDITGTRYLFPVGMAGFFWFAYAHMLRYSYRTQTRE